MTEVFGRLAPGTTLDQARAEISSVYATMKKDHPDAILRKESIASRRRCSGTQITFGARTILLVLLAAAGLVFIIACSNVANLILARTVRREGNWRCAQLWEQEGGHSADVACGESAALRYRGSDWRGECAAHGGRADTIASRFSVRALDLKVDSSLLWVGAGLALVAAVILAFVPRLPSADAAQGLNLSSGSVRIIGNTSRRQRIFAVTQIAASFVLLAGASTLITTLLELQRIQSGVDTRHVLAIDVPPMTYGKTPQQVLEFYKESIRRIDALPGVNATAFGMAVPWREVNGLGLEFSADGHAHIPGEDPRAQMRVVSPGFFAALGVPILAGRDFNEQDRDPKEPVAIISQTLAQRMFPNQDPINRHVYWTDPVLQFVPGITTTPQRIVGVTADIDDQHITPAHFDHLCDVRSRTDFCGPPVHPYRVQSLYIGYSGYANDSRDVSRTTG